MGFGKSTKVINALKNGRTKEPVLVVVNDNAQVDRYYRGNKYQNGLMEHGYTYYYSTKDSQEIRTIKYLISNLQKLDEKSEQDYESIIESLNEKIEKLELLDFEAVITELDKGMIITKQKFNQLLYEEEITNNLEQFNTFILDEISNLDLITEFKLDKITSSYVRPAENVKEPIKVKAKCYETPYNYFEKLCNNTGYYWYIPDTNPNNKNNKICLKNTLLMDFLNANNDKNIFILDATKHYTEYIYKHLDGYRTVELKEDLKYSYPNLTIQKEILLDKNKKRLTSSDTRIHFSDLGNTEKKEKILKSKLNILRKLKLDEKLIFTNKATEEAYNQFNEEQVIDYFYSGKDIGSNEYRNYKEMCILYGQSINKGYIKMLADFFNDDPDSIRENYLLQRTIQLIGRTAIRINSEYKVNIRIIHFLELKEEKLLNYFIDCKLNEPTFTKLDYEKIAQPKQKEFEKKMIKEIELVHGEFVLADEIEKAYLKLKGEEIKKSNKDKYVRIFKKYLEDLGYKKTGKKPIKFDAGEKDLS